MSTMISNIIFLFCCVLNFYQGFSHPHLKMKKANQNLTITSTQDEIYK